MDWSITDSKEYLEDEAVTTEEVMEGLLAGIDVALRDIEILTTGHNVLKAIVEKDDCDVEEVFSYYGEILAAVQFNDADDMLSRAGTTVEGVFQAIGNAIQRAWDAIVNFFKRLFGFATSVTNNATVATTQDLLEKLGTAYHNGDTFEWKKAKGWSSDDFKIVHTDIGDDMITHIEKQYKDITNILKISSFPHWTLTKNHIRKGAPGKLKKVIDKIGADNKITTEMKKEILDTYQTVEMRKNSTVTAKDAVKQLIPMLETIYKYNTVLAGLNLKLGKVRFDKVLEKGKFNPSDITKDDGRVISVDKSITNISDPLTYIRNYANITKAYLVILASTMKHYNSFIKSNIKSNTLKRKKK